MFYIKFDRVRTDIIHKIIIRTSSRSTIRLFIRFRWVILDEPEYIKLSIILSIDFYEQIYLLQIHSTSHFVEGRKGPKVLSYHKLFIKND